MLCPQLLVYPRYRVASSTKTSLLSLVPVLFTFEWNILPNLSINLLKCVFNFLVPKDSGPSDRVRTCGLMVPNCCPNFFPLVYSHFRSFPLGFPYSLTLFEALFPRVPRLTVVIYVVKNHCGAMGSSARKTK